MRKIATRPIVTEKAYRKTRNDYANKMRDIEQDKNLTPAEKLVLYAKLQKEIDRKEKRVGLVNTLTQGIGEVIEQLGGDDRTAYISILGLIVGGMGLGFADCFPETTQVIQAWSSIATSLSGILLACAFLKSSDIVSETRIKTASKTLGTKNAIKVVDHSLDALRKENERKNRIM